MPATKSKRRDKQSQGRINECIAIAHAMAKNAVAPARFATSLARPFPAADRPARSEPRIIVVGALTHFSALGLQYGRDVAPSMVHLDIWFRPFTQVNSFLSGCCGNWLARPFLFSSSVLPCFSFQNFGDRFSSFSSCLSLGPMDRPTLFMSSLSHVSRFSCSNMARPAGP